jgi:hypothetical protein
LICDLAFAIMPMFFVWRIDRPLLERILVSVLMTLGLCATASVAVKICLTMRFKPVTDIDREMLRLFLWCRLEEYLLIAAACAPFLKPPIEWILRRLGVAEFMYTTRGLNSFHTSSDLSDQQHSIEQSQEDK